MMSLIIRAISMPVRHRLSIVFINQAINLISFTYIIYLMGIETFGEFSKGLILIQISIIILEWGFQNHSAEILNKDTSHEKQSQYFLQTYLIKFILFVCIVLILFGIIALTYHEVGVKFYVGLIFVIFLGGINPLWFFNIIGQSRKLIFPTFIGKLIYLCLVLFLIERNSNYTTLYYFFGISYLIPCFWGLKLLFGEHIKILSISFKNLIKTFKDSFYFFLSSLVLHHISSFWSLFVTFNFSKSLIGYFVFIEQLYRGFVMISNLVGNSTRIETHNQNLTITKVKIINIIKLLTLIFALILISIYLFKLFKLNDTNLNFIFLITISWFVFSLSRLISYPLVAKLINYNLVNKIILFYGLLNLVLILVCQMFSIPSLFLIAFFMLIASCLEMIVYSYLIFIKLH